MRAMDVPTHEELLGSIDRFFERHPKIGEARFGRDATGEPGLVARLRRGSSPTLAVLRRISEYMAGKDAELAVAAVDDVAPDHAEDGTIDPSGSSPDISADRIGPVAA